MDGLLAEAAWAVVAVVEFSDGGPPERRVLYRGPESRCVRFEARLAGRAARGYGLVVEGDRPVLHYLTALCRTDQLEEDTWATA